MVGGALMGDFIQQLYAAKNICEQRGVKANLYISEGHGDTWTLGVEKAYNDLYDLIIAQPYINSFNILNESADETFINLSSWREAAATDFTTTGAYNICWSELLSRQFNFPIPADYQWITSPNLNEECKGRILVHRSTHRWGGLPWIELLAKIPEEVIFITSNPKEFSIFPVQTNVKLLVVNTITEMASCLASCRYFIGNQSAPFSLACALDIPRLGELEAGVWKFYANESKYSKNISWFLSNQVKHFSNELIQI